MDWSYLLKLFEIELNEVHFWNYPGYRTCDCVRMRTYLPTYGSLFEKTSSASEKYAYKKIDTHYCRQTASTTPSGVKAYVAQSKPLHLSYLKQKSKFSSYPWHSPVAYLQNFADNKISIPVGILQKNTRETTVNPLKIYHC